MIVNKFISLGFYNKILNPEGYGGVLLKSNQDNPKNKQNDSERLEFVNFFMQKFYG